MKFRILAFLIILVFTSKYSDVYSQNTVTASEPVNKGLDSLPVKGLIYKTVREKPDIRLSREQALLFLQNRYRDNNWTDRNDPLRKAIGQLIYFTSNNPFDSTRYFLEKYSYDSISIPWESFYVWDTFRLRIPVIPSPRFNPSQDTVAKADTILNRLLNDSLRSGIHRKERDLLFQSGKSLVELKDTTILVAVDTITGVTSSRKGFPFRYYNWPYESDSIEVAINSLISFAEERDSSIINISGTSNAVIPVWLNSKSDRLVRFWLRNEFSDSVTVWIGSISKNSLGLFLEEGIIFRRPTKQSGFSDAQLNLKEINSKSLQEVAKVYIKPQYWKMRSEASFILNQASLTNWVKGGESSISTAMDITGYADYNNKQLKMLSNNFIRLKYGLVGSKQNGIRKNLDLLETNSKLNHKAFGKFDFSATMLFKTQIAKGKNYIKVNNRDTAILVSRFMNPAILTIGLGLDYKPNKNTSINFAPLSYKGTFVTDTAHIDQTKYGIPHNRRSLHEPGVSFMITNEFKPFKSITIINRLQLFTNYIHNPQNIDVDWEMIATAKLNWFTDVRFNTHLVFDDDTKTLLYGKDMKPVSDRKTARIQFKELLGFTFVFRF